MRLETQEIRTPTKGLARLLICAVIAMTLASCNVGPKYSAPATPAPPAFKEGAPQAYKSALPGAWQPANPHDAELKGKWWEMFHEPELNALEEQLNIDNQNIAQYLENFMAARAQVSEARAGFFPTVSANPAITKSGTAATAVPVSAPGATGPAAGSTAGTSITGISLPLDISWAPDLWGRVRNTVRQYQYNAQVSAADLENERLTEQASLAQYYFELRGQDSLEAVASRLVDAYRQYLEVTRALVDTGIDDPTAVASAEASLASAQEAEIGIATNRALYEHAIATLIGKPASSFEMPVKELSTPVPAIPVGVPSQLLERRPDIAAAERTMAAGNALIGVEKTAYYPTLNLTGASGLEASGLAKLFSLPALFWSLGASATETIFDGGLRKATVAQYTAQYNADAAAYQQTVLTAFQQVEDYLATLRVVSQQATRQQEAVEASQRYVTLETARYDTGIDPYIDLVVAQLTLLNNQQTQVSVHANEMIAAVELVQALGGGWNKADLPEPSTLTGKDAAKEQAAAISERQ